MCQLDPQVIAQANGRATISALLVAWIDGCHTNTNNPTKQSSHWRASVRLLLPTIQPIHRTNKRRARLERSGMMLGLLLPLLPHQPMRPIQAVPVFAFSQPSRE